MKREMYQIALAGVLTVLGCGTAVAASYTMDEVIVEGERPDTIYAGGYMSRTTGIGMVQGKDTMEMPFQSMTLTDKVIKDFAMPNHDEVMDLLSFSPSVRKTTSRDLVAMRGKQVSAQQMTLNGIPGMYGNFSMGTNFAQSVDIVSGPALNYTGSATQNVIGGTVGFHTKQAQNTPIKNVGFSFMSDGHFTETLDWGQRFGGHDAWGVRVNALHGEGDLAVHGESLRQKNIFVNIDHRAVDGESNFFAGYAYSKHNGGNSMIQTVSSGNGNLLPYIPGAPNGKYNVNPDWAYQEKKVKLFTFNHMQNINEHWKAFFNAGIMKYDNPINFDGRYDNEIFKDHFDENGQFDGTFSRDIYLTASGREQRYVGAGFTSSYDFGFMKNEFLIGVDRNAATTESSSSTKVGTFEGNLYGNNDWEAPSFTRPATYVNGKAVTKGYTILDTMKFFDDKLILSAGVHHHSYETRTIDKSGKVTKSEKYDGNSPTYGAVYQFTKETSLYFNHAETFLGGTQVPDNKGYVNGGDFLPPAKTKSNEIGIKIKQGQFLHTLAFYRAEEPTARVDDKNHYGYNGLTRYDGIEYSTAGSLGDRWDIMASLGFNQYKYEHNSNSSWNGMIADGIPKWNANLALAYHVNDRFDILGRMSYIGSSDIGTDKNGRKHYRIPSYVRFDLGIKYKTKISGTPVTFSAMCYNLTNKKGWFTADQGNQLYAADPRSFVISADMNF